MARVEWDSEAKENVGRAGILACYVAPVFGILFLATRGFEGSRLLEAISGTAGLLAAGAWGAAYVLLFISTLGQTGFIEVIWRSTAESFENGIYRVGVLSGVAVLIACAYILLLVAGIAMIAGMVATTAACILMWVPFYFLGAWLHTFVGFWCVPITVCLILLPPYVFGRVRSARFERRRPSSSASDSAN